GVVFWIPRGSTVRSFCVLRFLAVARSVSFTVLGFSALSGASRVHSRFLAVIPFVLFTILDFSTPCAASRVDSQFLSVIPSILFTILDFSAFFGFSLRTVKFLARIGKRLP